MASTITNEHISQFINSIGSEYCIDEDKLGVMWEIQFRLVEDTKKEAAKGKAKAKPPPAKGKAKLKTPPAPKAVVFEGIDEEKLENLEKFKLAELREFCKNRGLKVSGTKNVLIARLRGEEEPESPKKGAGKGKTPTKKTKVVSDKAAQNIEEKSNVLKNMKDRITSIEIRRNHHGNIAHPETGLVFKKIDGENKVVGKQGDDGFIQNLNKEDIQSCKKFKFPYVQLPTNLDSKKEDEEEEEVIEDDGEEGEEEEEFEEEEEVEEEEEE